MKAEHFKFESNKEKHPSAQKLHYQTKITDGKLCWDQIFTNTSEGYFVCILKTRTLRPMHTCSDEKPFRSDTKPYTSGFKQTYMHYRWGWDVAHENNPSSICSVWGFLPFCEASTQTLWSVQQLPLFPWSLVRFRRKSHKSPKTTFHSLSLHQ